MTTANFPQIEAHLFAAPDYDTVQRWAHAEMGKPSWAGAANVTVSLSRGDAGTWQGHMYGFAPGPGVTAVPMRAGADYPLHLHPDYVRPATDVRGDGGPGSAMLDLGDIASGRVIPADYFIDGQAYRMTSAAPVPPTLHYVGEGTARMTAMPGAAPVPSEAMGSFFVPAALESAARGAAEQDAERSRRHVLDNDGPTFAAAGPPLQLDLDTEAPKLSRRAQRAAARAQQQPTVEPAPVVPASGHRPEADGVAPVEYPLCESRIWTAPGARRCTRQHRPGATNLVHTVDGYVWKDDDPRVIPDGVMHNPSND